MRLIASAIALAAAVFSVDSVRTDEEKIPDISAKTAAELVRDYTSPKKVVKTGKDVTHVIAKFPRVDYKYPHGYPLGPLHTMKIEHVEYHDKNGDGWGPGDRFYHMHNIQKLTRQYKTVDGKRVEADYFMFHGPGSNTRRTWRTEVGADGKEINTVRSEKNDFDPFAGEPEPLSGGTWTPLTDKGTGDHSTTRAKLRRFQAWQYVHTEPRVEKAFRDKAAQEAAARKAAVGQ